MMQQSTPELARELARLDAEYQRRDSDNISTGGNRYSLFNEAALLHAQGLQRSILTLLKQHNFTDLDEKKILDVGCGNGVHLLHFVEYGALATNLAGIDLMAHRIERAQPLQPTVDWRVGSAHQLPYDDASFDLVMSFVVFSSILDESLRREIATEMWRVRKPGGLILFYDFVYSNPQNPAVKGLNRRQVCHLFNRPGATFDFRRITLAPPVARKVAPRAYWLAYTLEQFKILNTHMICMIALD